MGQHIQHRLVPDPSMSDAEYYHQRSQKAGPNVGKVLVQENAMERIGALCFIRRRLSHHEQAAERFKTLYEARYGSGNPAMDPSRVQVDTSPIAHDSGMAAKIDRTRDIHEAEVALGKEVFNRIVACVVLGIPAGNGHHWRRRAIHVDELLGALDSLSTLWGYRTEAA